MNSVPECIAQSLRVSVEANTLPVMFVPGEVVSYLEMCRDEGVNLRRGMNFRIRGQKERRAVPRLCNTEESVEKLGYSPGPVFRKFVRPTNGRSA
jgi:hypothetical protein